MTDIVRSNLEAIIVRCEEGDKQSDWPPIIARLAREAIAALSTRPVSEGMGQSTFAWLIETGDHKYWDGRKADAIGFTADPNEAVRFARKDDADRVIYWLLQEYSTFLVAREHGWISLAAMSAAGDAPGPVLETTADRETIRVARSAASACMISPPGGLLSSQRFAREVVAVCDLADRLLSRPAWRGMDETEVEAAAVANLADAIRGAEALDSLPRCRHGNCLRDGGGEALEPPCGCRGTSWKGGA